MDNATVSTKGKERGLEKLESVIRRKNLRHNTILSDNLFNQVGDSNHNLRVIADKVDPTHMSVIFNNHDIIEITQTEGVRERPQTSQ